jgi:hypothetical protein
MSLIGDQRCYGEAPARLRGGPREWLVMGGERCEEKVRLSRSQARFEGFTEVSEGGRLWSRGIAVSSKTGVNYWKHGGSDSSDRVCGPIQGEREKREGSRRTEGRGQNSEAACGKQLLAVYKTVSWASRSLLRPGTGALRLLRKVALRSETSRTCSLAAQHFSGSIVLL